MILQILSFSFFHCLSRSRSRSCSLSLSLSLTFSLFLSPHLSLLPHRLTQHPCRGPLVLSKLLPHEDSLIVVIRWQSKNSGLPMRTCVTALAARHKDIKAGSTWRLAVIFDNRTPQPPVPPAAATRSSPGTLSRQPILPYLPPLSFSTQEAGSCLAV